eukprot:g4572.t1
MQSGGRKWRSVGSFKLPGGEAGEGVIELMLKYLDVKSFHALIQTSLIKQVSQISTGSAYLKTTCIGIYETYRDRIISKLNEKYIAEFPRGTPFICACETGRLEDVKMYLGTGAVDDVNMTGKRSNGFNHRTGLMLAVEKEHINVRLSVVAQTFKINTNTITLSGALKTGTQAIGESKVYKNELAPGDFIRVKDQVMRVEECRDGTQLVKSATDFTHACNVIVVSWGVGLYSASNSIANPHAGHAHSFRFGGQAWSELSGYNIYKFVLTQYRPEGTWEQWPGDFYGSGTLSDVEDEGHFYMECSNRGKCNRAWGQCECFPGYTGTACTRQACTCSGHGTCETVDELRKLDPVFQPFSVQTYKDSKIVHTEIEIDSTYGNNKVLIRANDYIQIDSHPPMKVKHAFKTTITLYSTFPETLPYGTHAWKVFAYDLWDKEKNRACRCDAMWTGNDCTQRKCPKGDDPLTFISYDPEQEGTHGTMATLPPEAGDMYYTGYSPYRQKAERQTLEIDSLNQPTSGTFKLKFTDEYGDEWLTRPIPLAVRLSQTLSSAINVPGATFLDFGNKPGIHVSEVGLGDIIRIGREYRLVTRLDYRKDDAQALDSSLQYYSRIHFKTGLAGSNYYAKQQHTSSAFRVQGTPVYRVTVAKEIREALKALPNDRITDVTVEAITRGGSVLDQHVTSSFEVTADRRITFANPLQKRKVGFGDILRFGDEYRQIETIVDEKAFFLTSSIGKLVNEQIFIQNGMKYEITFEQGCRTHHDCRLNGVDENDSDGPPRKRMYEGADTHAAYCHAGGTCMCSDGFFGHGCTRTGRGHHANYGVTVSGDIYNLKCENRVITVDGFSEGMTSGAILKSHLSADAVSRATPNKISLSSDVFFGSEAVIEGSHIRIENQIRRVQKVDLPIIIVDRPFEEVNTSDLSYIFPPHTPVEVIFHAGGVRSTCTVTDLRQLTTTQDICHYEAATERDVSACGHFTVNQFAIEGRFDQRMREVNPVFGLYAKRHVIPIPSTAANIGGDTLQFPGIDVSNIKPGMIANAVLTAYATDATAAGGGCKFFPNAASYLIVRSVGTNTIQFTKEVSSLGLTTKNMQSDSLDGNFGFGGGIKCCTGTADTCGLTFVAPPRIMDEREIEIGDRIRIITSPGNWETRTIDSITYAPSTAYMPHEVTGFVVSEPYENELISQRITVTGCTISNDNKLTKINHGIQLLGTIKENDWVEISCSKVFTANGVYKIKSIGNDDIEFDSNFDLPPPITTVQDCDLVVAHIAYNDGAGTTEAIECSNRGLCDSKTGECECFKGFFGEDCSKAIAFAL